MYKGQNRTTEGAIQIGDVPPGAYDTVVWRDLDTDARFDPEREPGIAVSRLWVPPGQAGVVDTVRLVRPPAWRPEEGP